MDPNAISHRNKNQDNYSKKADAHNQLGMNSTLYLAYRDLNDLLQKHLYTKLKTQKIRLLDFCCGVGLSTELVTDIVRKADYEVDATGIDISAGNLEIARQKLPEANFHQIETDSDLNFLDEYDLIICNFVLVEMPDNEMQNILRKAQSKLAQDGIIIVTNPTGRAYRQENQWYTFNNQFPENKPKRHSEQHTKLKFDEDQPIKIQVFASKDSDQSFTFFDYFHSGTAYRQAYNAAGLHLLETHKAVGKEDDVIAWEAEQKAPPYKQHVLGHS